MMILALVGVIYLMRTLNSGDAERSMSDPQSALGILIGAELRPLNWCPEDVSRIEIFDQDGAQLKSFTSKVELSRVCELMVGGFQKTDDQQLTFKKRIVASNAQGKHEFLEQANLPSIYRVQGMPFGSPMLDKALQALLDP